MFIQRSQNNTKANRLLCQRCSKSFKSTATLRQHTEVCFNRNSEPKFVCEICQKRFRTDIQFTRHNYYTHSKRTFTCKEEGCGRSFLSNSHLTIHMTTHTPNRPYPCTFSGCTYRARTYGRLAQHKVIHGQGRRFSCDYCDYSATTSSNLRRHARIHARARPYLCPHCPHRTSELDALKKHVLDSGRHPGMPLYVCPWCRIADPRVICVGFNASSLAWRHLINEHSLELTKPETLARVGRLSEKALSERDVTRLLGIYCPEIDSTQPPENVAVHQPSIISRHRRQNLVFENGPKCDGNKEQEQQADCEPFILDSNDPTVTKVPDSIDNNQTSQDASPLPIIQCSKDNLPSCDLIQIGSGALWSEKAVHCHLSQLQD